MPTRLKNSQCKNEHDKDVPRHEEMSLSGGQENIFIMKDILMDHKGTN